MTSCVLRICLAILMFGLSNIPVYSANSLEIVQMKGRITKSNDLPSGFYGTWSVTSRLLETNSPDDFGKESLDIWVFSKNGNVITLSNPVSGATASITVNEVRGNTATFTRKNVDENKVEIEKPNITINGSNFSGTDSFVQQRFKKGTLTGTSSVKYEIHGKKLSGKSLTEIFGQ